LKGNIYLECNNGLGVMWFKKWRGWFFGEAILEDVDFREVSEEYLEERGVVRIFCPKCDCCILFPKSRTFPVVRCPECALPHEKELCKWLLYINPYNKVYERCSKCNKIVWIDAKIIGNVVQFRCENCNAKYELDISEEFLLPTGKKGK